MGEGEGECGGAGRERVCVWGSREGEGVCVGGGREGEGVCVAGKEGGRVRRREGRKEGGREWEKE